MKAVTVPVLFTDLVGSTEMASRLGPEATEAVRQTHFRLLRDAVTATGGTEVKNLGDGLMVVFDSAGAAISGAVAMQQAIARHNQRGGEPLQIRIGLSLGDATTEDGDYFGTPVVEAARLCGEAAGGQILTTLMVSMLGRGLGHAFTPVGDLQLKGLPEPVAAVEVGWESAATANPLAIPLPQRIAAGADAPLVGRDEEWALLEQAAKAAQAGDRQVVLVAGEPGIGKTRLTAGLCRSLGESGATVLYGRCDEDLGVPYQPWMEALGHLVEHLPEDSVDRLIGSHGGELLRLLPHLEGRLGQQRPAQTSDPETERYLLFQAVCELIANVAAEAAVVMLLDDLHWADKPTLMLLRQLVGQSASIPLLILGTYRDTDTAAGSPLADALASLRREAGVQRLGLNGLDEAGVRALFESIAGQAMDETGTALARAISRETTGNPFFVGEILRFLNESGAIYQSGDGSWSARSEIDQILLPESVREVIGQRVARLGTDATKVLGAASVIGRDFDLGVLARVLDQSEDDVYASLELALGASLIREVTGVDDRYTFRHALVQHSLDADLTTRTRRQLHQKIAEDLEIVCGEDPGDRVGELATHWLAATAPVAGSKALHYAQLAGERALARLAPDEAVRWFEAVADLIAQGTVVTDERRARLLLAQGTAQRQAGDQAFRQTLLDAANLAKTIGDTRTLVTAALENSRGGAPVVAMADEERIAVLRTALAAVGEQDSLERARLLSQLAAELAITPPLAERVKLADEAVAIARRLGDPATLVDALTRPLASLFVPELCERRVSAVAEARGLLAHVEDRSLRFWTSIWSASVALEHGDVTELDAMILDAAAIAAEVRQPLLEWMVTNIRAVQALIAGEVDESERLAALAFEIATETGQPDGFTYYGTQLLSVRRHQGRSAEMIPLIREVAAASPILSSRYDGPLANHLFDAGELAEAKSLVEAALDARFDYPLDASWSAAIASWAQAAAGVENVEACRILHRILEPFAALVPSALVVTLPPFALNLGELSAVLGRMDEAEQHFREAERISVAMDAPNFLARTYFGWATALARAGETQRARDYVQRCIDVSNGRFGLAPRAEAILADLGSP